SDVARPPGADMPGANPFTSQPCCVLYGVGSKLVTRAAPLRPSSNARQNSGASLPIGVMHPDPVTTTDLPRWRVMGALYQPASFLGRVHRNAAAPAASLGLSTH